VYEKTLNVLKTEDPVRAKECESNDSHLKVETPAREHCSASSKRKKKVEGGKAHCKACSRAFSPVEFM
jgi:hypothetical protein